MATSKKLLRWKSRTEQLSEGVTMTIWRGEFGPKTIGDKFMEMRYFLTPNVKAGGVWMLDRTAFDEHGYVVGCDLISEGYETAELGKAAAESDAKIRMQAFENAKV